MLTFALVVVGNLLAIILFAMRKVIRKKSLFLVMNMTFAEIMLGSVSLPTMLYLTVAPGQAYPPRLY